MIAKCRQKMRLKAQLQIHKIVSYICPTSAKSVIRFYLYQEKMMPTFAPLLHCAYFPVDFVAKLKFYL